MKKILSLMALAMMIVSLQSCLHDDDEVFSESASVRIQKAVDEVKAKLTSSPNGWTMYYFTGEDYTGGGYNMLMRFDHNYAYVSADFAPADSVSRSTWDVKKDQGPVLTFDTHNELMHAKSEPSSGAIDGEEGDYEFVILRMTEDSIFVRGKKWNNHMVMVRNAENMSWEKYITDVQTTLNNLGAKYETTGGTGLMFNTNRKRMTTPDDGVGVAFYTTADGVWFAEPYEIDGVMVDHLDYNNNTFEMSSAQLGGAPFTEALIPLSEQLLNDVWYLTMEYGAGEGTMTYLNKARTLLAQNNGADIGYLAFDYITSSDWGFIAAAGTDDAGYTEVAMNIIPTVNSDDQVTFEMGGSIWGGIEYYQKYGFNYLINMFCDTWKITAVDNDKRPTVLHLTSTAYTGYDFYLTKNEVLYPFQ